MKPMITLQVGQHADLVVFDPATVRDAATYAAPATLAEGIVYVFGNGALTWLRGVHTGARRAQVITRRGTAAA